MDAGLLWARASIVGLLAFGFGLDGSRDGRRVAAEPCSAGDAVGDVRAVQRADADAPGRASADVDAADGRPGGNAPVPHPDGRSRRGSRPCRRTAAAPCVRSPAARGGRAPRGLTVRCLSRYDRAGSARDAGAAHRAPGQRHVGPRADDGGAPGGRRVGGPVARARRTLPLDAPRPHRSPSAHARATDHPGGVALPAAPQRRRRRPRRRPRQLWHVRPYSRRGPPLLLAA